MKKVLVVLTICAVVVMGYLAFTTVDSTTPVATAAGTTYSGTTYVAGMGGHFAKAEVTIDPSNENEPIKVTNLDRIVIGDKKTHPTHDARIDVKDRNTMFWSTYVLDPKGKQHVGKSDLKTGNVIKDVAMDPDASAGGSKPPLFCASGQSNGSYMPVFMGQEGYVDVYDKATMKHKERVWVSDLGYEKGKYKFTHGINSPDMKTFLLVLNQAAGGKGNGSIDFILVDMAKLEKGKFKQLAKNTLKGAPDKTITFRQYFSNDGTRIYQSAGDRLWVLDAKTLALIDEKMMPEGNQIHDAQTTPDDKYAMLTVRTVTAGCDADGRAIVKEGKGVDITDGTLMLYDADAKKLNVKSTSVCLECHKGMGLGDKNAVLCGLDTNWK
ncbi:MAG: hypothetical protein A2X58_00315 [Nitrospirae bacterium GWC2_56_14]|nr:MAG: hypothetical protein A2X58_00315 [Nitrospirae bacterium GWC2_56_14]